MTVVRHTPGPLRVAVAPGAVAVLGDGATDAVAEAVWTQLHAGAGLAGVVDALAAGGPLSAVPAFAVAIDEDDAWRVAVRGSLTVVVGEVSAGERIDGAGASTWAERSIRSADVLTISASPADAAPGLPVCDGVVGAAAVTISREEAAPARRPAARPVEAGEPVQPHSVAEVHDVAPAPALAPAPAPARAAAPAAPPKPSPVDAPTPVAGVPALGEDVEATIIRGATEADGSAEDDETITLAEARALRAAGRLPPVAPPLSPPAPASAAGVLRVSNGQSVVLDRTVIVGRRPRSTRITGDDLPHLLAVDSPQQDISRNHVEVRVEADSILATDLQTTNGTTLLRRGSEPVRLHPGEPTILVPGDVLDLGDGITLTVEGAS